MNRTEETDEREKQLNKLGNSEGQGKLDRCVQAGVYFASRQRGVLGLQED